MRERRGWGFDTFHNLESCQRLRGNANAWRLTKHDSLEGFELAEVVRLSGVGLPKLVHEKMLDPAFLPLKKRPRGRRSFGRNR